MTAAVGTDDATLLDVQVDSVDVEGLAPVDEDGAEYRAVRSSIRASGVRTPIVVVPCPSGRFQLVEGRLRLRAARSLGLTAIPAEVRGALAAPAAPVATAPAPAETPAPAVEMAAPVADTPAPAVTTPAPVAERAEAAPVPDRPAPAPPATAPVPVRPAPAPPAPAPTDAAPVLHAGHGGYAAGARSRRWRSTTPVRRPRPAPTADVTAAADPATTPPAAPDAPPARPAPVAGHTAAVEAPEPTAEPVTAESDDDGGLDRIGWTAVEAPAPAPEWPVAAATAPAPVEEPPAAPPSDPGRGWQVRRRPTVDGTAAMGRLARLAEGQAAAPVESPAPGWGTRSPHVDAEVGVQPHVDGSNGTAPAVDVDDTAALPLDTEDVDVAGDVDSEPDDAGHLEFVSALDAEDDDEDDLDEDEDEDEDDLEAEADDDFDPLPDEPGVTETGDAETKLPSATPGVTRAAGMLAVAEPSEQHAALRPFAQLRERATRRRAGGDVVLVGIARTGGTLLGLFGAALVVITLATQGDGASVSPVLVYGAIGGFLTALLALAHERVKAARSGR